MGGRLGEVRGMWSITATIGIEVQINHLSRKTFNSINFKNMTFMFLRCAGLRAGVAGAAHKQKLIFHSLTQSYAHTLFKSQNRVLHVFPHRCKL